MLTFNTTMLLYKCNKDKQERNLKMSEEFSRKTMLSIIGEALDDGYKTLEDIQTDKTNTDPWIIGRYQATKALEKFDDDDNLFAPNPVDNISQNGILGAIGYVRSYELDSFGVIETDVSDPEEIASVVAYINMENVLNDLMNDLDLEWDKDLTDSQLDKINNYINQQLN